MPRRHRQQKGLRGMAAEEIPEARQHSAWESLSPGEAADCIESNWQMGGQKGFTERRLIAREASAKSPGIEFVVRVSRRVHLTTATPSPVGLSRPPSPASTRLREPCG